MSLFEKVVSISAGLSEISAGRNPDAQGTFDIKLNANVNYRFKGVRKDYKGVKISATLTIKPEKTIDIIRDIHCVFDFTLLLNEPTNKEELGKLIKDISTLNREFLPYMDSYIAGLTKEMKMTPIIISKMFQQQSPK